MNLSFMLANFIARERNYPSDAGDDWTRPDSYGGWGGFEQAVRAHFDPAETFAERYGALLDEVAATGLTQVDLWVAHLMRDAADTERIATARRCLDERGLKAVSLAGSFGNDLDAVRRSCRIAKALGCSILGGGCQPLETDFAGLVAVLEEEDCVLAFENHPNEKTAEDVLAKIHGGTSDRVRVCLDTGWFGTNGEDASRAIRELAPYLAHVHLKDVTRIGAHETCALGQGVVGIAEVMATLNEVGYEGALSIEHESANRNPVPEVIESIAWLKSL